MIISKRLKAIAKYTMGFESLVDIGCDHGLLVAYALKSNYVKKAYLLDVKEEPLKVAKKNIMDFNLSAKAEFQISDGLKEFNKQAECFVVAGLGTQTIISIITNDLQKFQNAKRIILSSHKDKAILREFLNQNKFQIIDEEIVLDKHYYEIIVIEPGSEKLTEEQIFFGPLLLKKRSDIFNDYYQNELKKLKTYKKLSEKTKKRLQMIEDIFIKETK